MDPVTMLMIGGTVASAAGTIFGGINEGKAAVSAATAQAKAMREEAKLREQFAEKTADEERQRGFFEARQRREAGDQLVSSAIARAARSGGGVNVPTVAGILDQIVGKTEEGAQSEILFAAQRAQGIIDEAKLEREIANKKSRVLVREAKYGAKSSLVPTLLSAGGTLASGIGKTYKDYG